ncbi:MAG: alanine racemase [Bryobacterales bacterium]|nr:alanine racemase [Bryobacterales bacterium]
MAGPPYRTWVEVSRARIVENYRRVRAVVGAPVEVMAVVKADAYGHGAVEVSRLLESEGARWLAVSNVEEGAALRRAGVRARILVMADCLPSEHEGLAQYALTPVVHSLEDLAGLESFAEARPAGLAYHLKLDTGMGRLGTRAPAEEIVAAIRRCRRLQFEGLTTHFASSADYSTAQTDRQIEVFEEVLEALRRAGTEPRWIHLSSTNPVAYGRRRAWGNLVRAGHSLYGYVSPAKGSAPARTLEVKPALAWKARILAVKKLPAGTRVGYGGTFRAERPTTIAILAAGYADGVPHRMGNRGKVIAGGQLVPVIGAVSMDLTTIDITDVPDLAPGDAVTLLGQEGNVELNAQQVARWAGTISYTVLCAISPRVPRVYV